MANRQADIYRSEKGYSPMISVLVLTLNEEKNLESCLESVSWSDDIVVFDSYSTDRTLEIAKMTGARVIQRKFDNELDHRTASLKLNFKYPWLYNPDADEITTPELRDEMLSVVSDTKRTEVAYRVRFKTMFMGKWIRHSSLYPTWVMRLFRPEKIRFERATNLTYIADGAVGFLQSHFKHYSFKNGLNAWFEKHNKYSWHEAQEAIKHNKEARLDLSDLLDFSNPVLRRRTLKELLFRLPFRPTLRFLYMYFFRLGFLDGLPGLTYCRLLSMYEQMIVLKMKEIRRREKGLPI